MNSLRIVEYYSGKTIFITGGTGFIGVCLVEKLLRACPGIKKIILPIRVKKMQTVHERAQRYFDDEIFNLIKETREEKLFQKVEFIEYDISKPFLGIELKNIIMILNTVNIIFHCAATIKFSEKLYLSLLTNFQAVKSLVVIAKQIKHLEAFVHVSTAYVNTFYDEDIILEEKVYQDNSIDVDYLQDLMENSSPEIINAQTSKLLQNYINTYIFTKNATERLLYKIKDNLPVAIFRPAVVCVTYRDPFPGWTNSYFGAISIAIGIELGTINFIPLLHETDMSYTPVDMGVNCMIAIACNTAINRSPEITVYNFGSSNNSVTKKGGIYSMQKFTNLKIKEVNVSFFFYNLILLITNSIPAYFADLWLKIQGKKPKHLKLVLSSNKLMSEIYYFITQNQYFLQNNSRELWNKLDENEKKLFNFDINYICWDEYFAILNVKIKKLISEKNINFN